MRTPAPTRRLALAALLAAGAMAAGASPAGARAPSASEEGSLDWITQKLKEDREEDLHPQVPLEELKIQAYQKGETALDEWRPVTEIILDKEKKQPQIRRGKATSALIDRMGVEERKGTDREVLGKVKREICNSLLKLILAEDVVSRNYIYRLTEAFLTQRVDWKPDDSYQKRKQAYDAYYRALNKR